MGHLTELIARFRKSGLTLNESLKLVELRLEEDTSKINRNQISSLLGENILGIDYQENYEKLLNAGLSKWEADFIFKNRIEAALKGLRTDLITFKINKIIEEVNK